FDVYERESARLIEAGLPLPAYEQVLKASHTFNLLDRSEEHTSELQSRENLVCRLLLEKKKNKTSGQKQKGANTAVTTNKATYDDARTYSCPYTTVSHTDTPPVVLSFLFFITRRPP